MRDCERHARRRSATKRFPWSSPTKTWWRALAVGAVFLVSATACSDVDGNEPGNTIIEVFASESNNGAGYAERLLYSIECVGLNDEVFDNRNPADDVRVEGPFAKTSDETYSGVDVWRALAVLPPGPCVIQVQAFDSGNQAICTMSELFEVSREVAAQVRLTLVCSGGIQVTACSFSKEECNARTPEMCAADTDCVIAYGTPLERGCLDAASSAAPVGCTAGCDVDGGLEVVLDPDDLPWLVRADVLPGGWSVPSEPFHLVVCEDEPLH